MLVAENPSERSHERGRRQRDGALRCRSLPAAWKMIRLSNSLAQLEHEAYQALTRY